MNKVSLNLLCNNNKKIKFKLNSIKVLHGEHFYTFITKKKIGITLTNYIVEIKEHVTKRKIFLQLSNDTSKFVEFFKEKVTYLQQEHDYDSFKLIIRYGTDLHLKEIVYKF